jgi:preprotein translocase subunit SecB
MNMAEGNGSSGKTPAPAAGAADGTGQPAASLSVVGQYIRDLSFENPDGPNSIGPGKTSPGFNVGVNVQIKKQSDDVYAVELTLNTKAERDGKVLFNIELVYGGLFRLQNVADNQLSPLLMIECPRLLFPFARQVLANVTQSGGFPPLMLEPIDFVALYRQNLQKMAEQAQAAQKDGGKA